MDSLINLSIKFLLSAFCVLNSIVDAKDFAVNKTYKSPGLQEANILVGKKQRNI